MRWLAIKFADGAASLWPASTCRISSSVFEANLFNRNTIRNLLGVRKTNVIFQKNLDHLNATNPGYFAVDYAAVANPTG